MNIKTWVCGAAALCCVGSAQAAKMYAGDVYGTLYDIDPLSKTVSRQIDGGVAADVYKMVAHPTYPYLYAVASPILNGQVVNGSIRVINTISGMQVGEFMSSAQDHRFSSQVLSADGLRLYAVATPNSPVRLMTERGTFMAFGVHPGQPFVGFYDTELMSVTGMGAVLTGIATANVGGMNKVFISDDELRALHIIDADAGQIRKTILFGNNVHAWDVAVVGNNAYVMSDNQLFVVDINTENWTGNVGFSSNPNVSYFVSRMSVEGTKLILPTRSADQQAVITLYDVVTQNIQTIVATPEYNFYGVEGPIAGDGLGGFFQGSTWTVFHGNTTPPAMDASIVFPTSELFSSLVSSPGGIGQCSRK